MTQPIERCVLRCFSPEGYTAIRAKPVGEFSLVEALRAQHDQLSLNQIVEATDTYPCMQVVDITPLTTGVLTDTATCVVLPPQIDEDEAAAAAPAATTAHADVQLNSESVLVQLHANLHGAECLADSQTATQALLLSGKEGLFSLVGDVASTTFFVHVVDSTDADVAGGAVTPSTACFRLLVGEALFRNMRRVVCQMPCPLALSDSAVATTPTPLHYGDTTIVLPVESFAAVEDAAGNPVSCAKTDLAPVHLTTLQLAPALDDFFLTNVIGDGYFDLLSTVVALAAPQLDGKVVSDGDVVFVRLSHEDVAHLGAQSTGGRVDGVDVVEAVYAELHHGVEKWDGVWLPSATMSPRAAVVVAFRVVGLSGGHSGRGAFGVVNVAARGGTTSVSLAAPVSASHSLDCTPVYAPTAPPGCGSRAFPALETWSALVDALAPALRPSAQPPQLHVLVVHGIKENWPYEVVERALQRFGLRSFCVSVDALESAELEIVLDRFLSGASSHHAALVIKNAQNLLPEKRHLLTRLDGLGEGATAGGGGGGVPSSPCSEALPSMPRLVILVCESVEAVPPSIAARATNAAGVMECGNPSENDRREVLDWLVGRAVARFDMHRSLLLSTSALAAWTVGLPLEEIAAYAEECFSTALQLVPRDGSAATAVRSVLSDTLCEDTLQRFLKSHGHNLVSTKLQPVRWSDVGGLEDAKRELRETIQLPMLHPELFTNGMKKRTGILFYGPPGCGKTLLAKAVATEMNMNFMSVKGPELINQYVGESEKNIRLLFQKARDNSPCIVFFDELDALVPARGAKGDAGGAMDRIVSQLLVEVDGVGQKRSDGTASGDVFIIGATNRPDLLDPSLLRPGRFDRLCYLGMPSTKEEQLYAVKALTRKFDLAKDVDLRALIAPLDVIYTGADFFALCSDAMMFAVEESLEDVRQQMDAALAAPKACADTASEDAEKEDNDDEEEESQQKPIQVTMQHFLRARDQLKPSVTKEDLHRYEALKSKFSS